VKATNTFTGRSEGGALRTTTSENQTSDTKPQRLSQTIVVCLKLSTACKPSGYLTSSSKGSYRYRSTTSPTQISTSQPAIPSMDTNSAPPPVSTQHSEKMDYSPLGENESTDKLPEIESDTCSTQCERCFQASGQMTGGCCTSLWLTITACFDACFDAAGNCCEGCCGAIGS
jgi:hypothetical protein